MALSADGKRLILGAYDPGAFARVYNWNGTDWDQLGIDAELQGSSGDKYGTSVSLSGDGTILAVGMMFEYSLKHPEVNIMIKSAVEKALNDGIRTRDIGGKASSEEMTEAIEKRLPK